MPKTSETSLPPNDKQAETRAAAKRAKKQRQKANRQQAKDQQAQQQPSPLDPAPASPVSRRDTSSSSQAQQATKHLSTSGQSALDMEHPAICPTTPGPSTPDTSETKAVPSPSTCGVTPNSAQQHSPRNASQGTAKQPVGISPSSELPCSEPSAANTKALTERSWAQLTQLLAQAADETAASEQLQDMQTLDLLTSGEPSRSVTAPPVIAATSPVVTAEPSMAVIPTSTAQTSKEHLLCAPAATATEGMTEDAATAGPLTTLTGSSPAASFLHQWMQCPITQVWMHTAYARCVTSML